VASPIRPNPYCSIECQASSQISLEPRHCLPQLAMGDEVIG
jgi:hypothetical protein